MIQYIYIYTYILQVLYVCTYVYINMVCVYIYIYIYIYVYIFFEYMCIYIDMYVKLYMYIQTLTHLVTLKKHMYGVLCQAEIHKEPVKILSFLDCKLGRLGKASETP